MPRIELSPWKLLSRQSLLKAHPWFEVFKERVRLPSGRVISDFFTISAPDFVAIVAIDQKNRVILERYYKHGARRIVFAVPGGGVEPGERPLQSAKRELLEETGHVAERWSRLGSFIIDANRANARGHFFLAEGCRQIKAPNSGDLEETQLHFLPLQRAWALTRSEQGVSIGAMAALALASIRLRQGSTP